MVSQTIDKPAALVRQQSATRLWRRLREIGLGYLLLAPALLILLVFDIFPLFYGLYISMCDWRLSCVKFVGADNYVRALNDPAMWHALGITATYSFLTVPLQLGLALLVAYLLFQNIRGKSAFRVAFFLPYVTSTVASAAVWAYLYSPDKGLFNNILKTLGLPPLKWLGEPGGVFQLVANNFGVNLPNWADGPSLALIAVLLYGSWVFLGYDVAIFLAGLGNIPRELYDAAKVDGASGWALFRHITFPLLSPTTFFLLILTVIGTFQAFNHIYVMTLGGPGDATKTASIFIFEQLFQFNRYGYSAALSFILFFVILLLTIAQNRAAKNRVVYE
ncbi:MAG: sugar ABC transporter permease [Chloroflexi bacterium]|nr:sugar ABC transporter permease [Chloroflexota bacterium]